MARMKDIEGYEGRYAITDDGRVWSYRSGKFLKSYNNGRGYLQVSLFFNGFCNHKLVHRLVAQAFIENPNPNEFDEVNHKDENPLNNRVENLEWCSRVYNLNYGTCIQRRAESNRAEKNKGRISLTNYQGEELIFDDLLLAAHYLEDIGVAKNYRSAYCTMTRAIKDGRQKVYRFTFKKMSALA